MSDSRVVLTAGTFDLLHVGHVALFRECRKLAGELGRVIVAVNTDEFVARFKRQPVVSFFGRAEMIKAIKYVDDVVGNDGSDQAGLIESCGPDILAVGTDWATKDYYSQIGVSQLWLHEQHISLVYVAHEYTNTVSTTQLRDRVTGNA